MNRLEWLSKERQLSEKKNALLRVEKDINEMAECTFAPTTNESKLKSGSGINIQKQSQNRGAGYLKKSFINANKEFTKDAERLVDKLDEKFVHRGIKDEIRYKNNNNYNEFYNYNTYL